MIIVFFEYNARPIFFGVTTGKQATRCSLSREEIANELYDLQQAEWEDEADIPKPEEVQGVARREPAFVDGRWVLLDVVDGVIFVVANLGSGLDYFLLQAAAPNEVYAAEDEADAYDAAERFSSNLADTSEPMPRRRF
jgi:hypothetical protein